MGRGLAGSHSGSGDAKINVRPIDALAPGRKFFEDTGAVTVSLGPLAGNCMPSRSRVVKKVADVFAFIGISGFIGLSQCATRPFARYIECRLIAELFEALLALACQLLGTCRNVCASYKCSAERQAKFSATTKFSGLVEAAKEKIQRFPGGSSAPPVAKPLKRLWVLRELSTR